MHAGDRWSDRVVAPHPRAGGRGRFIRDVIRREKRLTKRGRPVLSERGKARQPLKKGQMGWLHRRMS